MSCGGTFRKFLQDTTFCGSGSPRAKADIAKTDLSILKLDEALRESFKVVLSFPLFPI